MTKVIIGINSIIGYGLIQHFINHSEESLIIVDDQTIPSTIFHHSNILYMSRNQFINFLKTQPDQISVVIQLPEINLSKFSNPHLDCFGKSFLEFDLKLFYYLSFYDIKYITVFDKTYYLLKYLTDSPIIHKNLKQYDIYLENFQSCILSSYKRPAYWNSIQTNIIYGSINIFSCDDEIFNFFLKTIVCNKSLICSQNNMDVSIDWIFYNDIVKLILWFVKYNKPGDFYPFVNSYRRNMEESLNIFKHIYALNYNVSINDIPNTNPLSNISFFAYNLQKIRKIGYHKNLTVFEKGLKKTVLPFPK